MIVSNEMIINLFTSILFISLNNITLKLTFKTLVLVSSGLVSGATFSLCWQAYCELICLMIMMKIMK